jgi:2-methylcitrate dehydratase PrpD
MALALHQCGMRGLPSLFVDEPAGRKQILGFGEDWLILRQYFKLYPTCRWTHAPVEAAVRLHAAHGFAADQIDRIVVESFDETATLMKFPPEDSDGAQYCLPWAMAAMLVDGELGVPQILPARLTDPRILDLGRRVSVRPAPDIQARFPAECLARVTISLKDGRTFSRPTAGARGDWTDPASDAEMHDKFMRLTVPAIGEPAALELSAVLDTLEDRTASDLLGLLGRAAS